jgi:uncharacterized protein (DUF1499 family)
MRILWMILVLVSCNSQYMSKVGLIKKGDKIVFRPCPKKSNCYSSSSHEKEGKNYFNPISIREEKKNRLEKAKRIVLKMGGKVVTENEDYLHAVFTSSVFKFIDDMELYFGEEDLIHLKSSSRVGSYDFGVNSERLRNFTFRYHQSR